jgi:hypothetical protein
MHNLLAPVLVIQQALLQITCCFLGSVSDKRYLPVAVLSDSNRWLSHICLYDLSHYLTLLTKTLPGPRHKAVSGTFCNFSHLMRI